MVLPFVFVCLCLKAGAFGAAVDTVPPTCSFCPSDIEIKNATSSSVRVNWAQPVCSDDSGLLVITESNRHSGDIFHVPGSYEVNYLVRDEQGNTYDGCKFIIDLEKKTCPLYDAPTNGALVCNFIDSDPACMVMCKEGYDFEFNPSEVYFCSAGAWNFFSVIMPASQTLPWPNCKSTAGPSLIKQSNPLGYLYFFNGDVNGPDVQTTIKQNYITYMTSGLVIPSFCKFRQEDCNSNTVVVYGGKTEDTVPPTCSFCPSDIEIKDATSSSVRVNWAHPVCSDDSGLPVITESNRHSGDIFDVPGIYEVNYLVRDEQGNTYDGCKFKIDLEKKTCPLYDAPTNGALACNFIDSDPVCMVMCKEGYDFEFNPSEVYFCSAGAWNFFSVITPASQTLPWPNCKSTAGPSLIKQRNPLDYLYFFDGDVNGPDVQTTIKQNYITYMTSGLVFPSFCKFRQEDCNSNTVVVYGGKTEDTVPPTCSFCPSDIEMKNVTSSSVRVNWAQPVCSDDSGLPVITESNRPSGDIFHVPGIYEVNYLVRDEQGNTYHGCEFKIDLEKKTCPLYDAPTNGALACNFIDSDPACMVMCKEGYDFEFNPSEVYFCSAGAWNFFSVITSSTTTLPWPDCKSDANPSWLKRNPFIGRSYFFEGDVNDLNTKETIKQNFIDHMTSPFTLPFFCTDQPAQCSTNTVQVYGGKVV